MDPVGGPVLRGVDHTARPTWKLRETIEFYRDALGLPLVHAITAKGWGRENEQHADFIHFFFDSGRGSTIAFFYYIGTQQPDTMRVPRGYMAMANHTAWSVDSEEELLAWQTRLEEKGVRVSQSIRHEILESIYFRDPNGYPLEITRSLRDLEPLDAIDAELTVAAALELEESGRWDGIESLWRTKASLVRQHQQDAADQGALGA
ncbi:VOC family protein [Lichenicoccus sp.]|uniref:VOC family protein n=1 Tax=Lichenicoccus sp. TaxID=2781899 RepID=UPI003D0DB7BA